MRICAAVAVLTVTACSPADPPSPEVGLAADTVVDPINDALRTEILRLGLLDRTVRAGFTPEVARDTAFLRASLAMDSALSRRLRSIVSEHGWPTRSLVGDDAADAAALILMHSPSDAFQREMLPLLDEAAALGQAGRNHAATLTDRLLTYDGKPQLFGTQFRIIDGTLVPYAILDAEQLETRRAAAGLSTMAEYVAQLRETYGGPVLWPIESMAGSPDRTVSPPADTTGGQSPA